MKLFVVKCLNNTLKADTESDYEKIKKIKVGEIVEIELKKKRNIKFHRLFFCLLNMIYENQERYNNIDDLRQDLTISAGFYTTRENLQGELIKKADSISFSSMDEHDFRNYYDRVLDEIVFNFNFGKQDILDYVEQYFNKII